MKEDVKVLGESNSRRKFDNELELLSMNSSAKERNLQNIVQDHGHGHGAKNVPVSDPMFVNHGKMLRNQPVSTNLLEDGGPKEDTEDSLKSKVNSSSSRNNVKPLLNQGSEGLSDDLKHIQSEALVIENQEHN